MSRLGPSAMVSRMASALPNHQKGDDGSDLASSYEVIALLIHSYLEAIGFRLVGFDEGKPLPKTYTFPRLPPQWNDGFGSLSFAYTHKQSSMTFVFRVDRLGSKVEVRGLALGDEKIYRFEKAVGDVINNSNLPVRITMTHGGEYRGDLEEKLCKVFVSEEAIASVLRELKVNIVQKLVPKLQCDGYIEEAEAEANAWTERRAQEARDPRRPFAGPRQPNAPLNPMGPLPLPEMARPRPAPVGDFSPPGFEDEHQMQGLAGQRQPWFGGTSPYNIGHDDLNPPGLGPQDPLRGSFVGGGGLPRPGASGMHPTFDDPLFGGLGSGDPRASGDGYNPQAPPGARWDPTGPGGNPRFPGSGRGQGGGFGGFGGGFGGDII